MRNSKCYTTCVIGWDGIVSIVTDYELDGMGIESHWGVRFFTPIHPRPVTHTTSYAVGMGSFPQLKAMKSCHLTLTRI